MGGKLPLLKKRNNNEDNSNNKYNESEEYVNYQIVKPGSAILQELKGLPV